MSNIIPYESRLTSLWYFVTREIGELTKETEQMTANTQVTAGAVSGEMTDWYAIDWRQVNRIVRRLQARIVKATQLGKWGKVKALQHLLTHSFSGKALAVRRVTENQGKRTPGVDKEIWDTPNKKAMAIHRQDSSLPHRSRNSSRSNLLAGSGEYGFGWFGEKAEGEISQGYCQKP